MEGLEPMSNGPFSMSAWMVDRFFLSRWGIAVRLDIQREIKSARVANAQKKPGNLVDNFLKDRLKESTILSR